MARQAKEILLEQNRVKLKDKDGGGQLRFEVWGYHDHGKTVVTRYNLAYINHLIHAKDNGRVLGFDNAHNFHHRHLMGVVEPVTYVSHEATLERFQREWQEIVEEQRKISCKK